MADTLIHSCPSCGGVEECTILEASKGRHRLKLQCPKCEHIFNVGKEPRRETVD